MVEKKQIAGEPIALDIAAVIAALGGNVSEQLIRLELKRGKLRSTKIGRRVLIMRSELLRYLNENDSEPE
jgi:excisionase family DNA binding protein